MAVNYSKEYSEAERKQFETFAKVSEEIEDTPTPLGNRWGVRDDGVVCQFTNDKGQYIEPPELAVEAANPVWYSETHMIQELNGLFSLYRRIDKTNTWERLPRYSEDGEIVWYKTSQAAKEAINGL